MSGGAASVKLGRLPFAGVGDQRELADHEDVSCDIEQRAVEAPSVVLEHTQARHLCGQPDSLFVAVSVRRTPSRTRRPRWQLASTSPATRTSALETRCTTARISREKA